MHDQQNIKKTSAHVIKLKVKCSPQVPKGFRPPIQIV